MRYALSVLKLLKNVMLDGLRYARHANHPAKVLNPFQIEARLLQKAHSIEKGLAMPQPRFGFGKAALAELRTLWQQADQAGLPAGSTGRRMASASMHAYLRFHDAAGQTLPDDLAFVRQLAQACGPSTMASTLTLSADDFRDGGRGDFEALTRVRHSFRMFSHQDVDQRTVEAAVRLATRSPSVCNRQAARVYFMKRSDTMREVLSVQGGNRGFADEIPVLLVVTADLSVFRGSRERYQAWIDGGLFSMCLLHALTFEGLGSCPLNWSADHDQDRRLRQVVPIPEHETVIMLIAVGHVRRESTVAASPRKSLEDVFRVV